MKEIFFKYIRCNNAGENILLKKECEKQGFGIQLEFTALGMLQQNGRVKRKAMTLLGRARARLNKAQQGSTRLNLLTAKIAVDFGQNVPTQ